MQAIVFGATSGRALAGVVGPLIEAPVLVGLVQAALWARRCSYPRRPPVPDHATDVPEVLFVCVHNAGRSQMAAALLDHHAQGRVRVRSAGSEPADQINPAVVEVMNEIGIDVSKETPRKLRTEDVAASDVVVTMGCGDTCPVFPGKRYEDWALTDPAGRGPGEVRRIRDEIDRRVQRLLAELSTR